MFTVVDLLPEGNGLATDMNARGFVTIAALGFDASLFIPQDANSAQGTVQPLAPPAGVTAHALALNDRDGPDVVGWSGLTVPGDAFQQAALWRNCGVGGGTGGVLASLIRFAGVSIGASRALDINDERLIVGWCELTPGGIRRAVMWDGERPFDPPRALEALAADLPSEALSINNRGQIVGTAQSRDGAGRIAYRAVEWDANTLRMTRDHGTLASAAPVTIASNTEARAINDAGTIVGVGDMDEQSIRRRAGFIIPAGGVMQLIPTLPGLKSDARNISPNGTVALTMPVPLSREPDHGATFSFTQGLFDIDQTTGGAAPGGHGLSGGCIMTEARAVNDHGQICGGGSTPSKFTVALLLVP